MPHQSPVCMLFLYGQLIHQLKLPLSALLRRQHLDSLLLTSLLNAYAPGVVGTTGMWDEIDAKMSEE